MKLIRIWGGDEEEDENKFFKTPSSVTVDNNQLVYICDQHNHCVKVFNNKGKYLHTIGRRGQGPGDLYGPKYIIHTIEENLLVYELCNRRFQWFDKSGKSKRILKCNVNADWIGQTSLHEIAVYDSMKTFRNRKLISIIGNKGKLLREFGMYHDKSKNYLSSEKLKFAIDSRDKIYAANANTPVIRKYSSGGKLLKVITFETPFEILVEITLNSSGDEIERKEEIYEDGKVKVVQKKSGISIQHEDKRTKYGVCIAIGIDSQNRIYVISQRRSLTEKESKGFAIYGNQCEYIKRDRVDYSVVENIDAYRLMVFDKTGKIIAQCTLTTVCENLYLFKNRIFFIDGYYNQRILEYELTFK
jgi:hypothetical protein